MNTPRTRTKVSVDLSGVSKDFQVECKRIAEELAGLKALAQLHLGFRETRFDDAACETVAQLLRSSPYLTHLSLIAPGTTVTDVGATTLSSVIAEIPFLTHLNIQISHDITNTGASRICDAISASGRLTELTLCFEECKHIGDATVRALAKAVEAKKKMTHLHVLLAKTAITDGGVAVLVETIRGMKYLVALTVDLQE
eukprot:TRINITY_DN10954_c0_g1_i2.p1 TRINITY_DN10954_c0_g1~~TRINITY_DN10954_c0_g1_i2.p1  ORF type:complete len:198 (-),score=43.11 TRINITY_DN10954_c0_g1_i2:582-1175(-)